MAKKIDSVPAGTKENATIFDRVTVPIIENNCIEYHSESKSNSNHRMITLKALHKGGNTDPALFSNNSLESSMLKSIHVPLENKKHLPPKGKLQLNEGEINLITWWIEQGATHSISLIEALPNESAVDLLEKGLSFEVKEPKLEIFSWKKPVVLSKYLIQNTNIIIRRIALGSPALSVYFAPTQKNIDESFNTLETIENNITQLNLGRTTFTEPTAKGIGEYTNLQILNSSNTPIDDSGIAHLQRLRELKTINL